MKKLDGKVAIITGGAQGMGAVHAKFFVHNGAKVIIADINEKNAKELVEELGKDAYYLKLDVTNEENWNNLVESVTDKFKKIDILVNNAGISFVKSIFDITVNDYMKIVEINQLGTFLGIKSVGKIMKQQEFGSIINVSSLNGIKAGAIGYTDTKFAIRGMTKAAAAELAQYNIRVNSVHPGIIDTAMIRQNDTGSSTEKLKDMIPLKRIGLPEDVSKLIVFLSSDDSSYSTGSEFLIDGGLNFK